MCLQILCFYMQNDSIIKIEIVEVKTMHFYLIKVKSPSYYESASKEQHLNCLTTVPLHQGISMFPPPRFDLCDVLPNANPHCMYSGLYLLQESCSSHQHLLRTYLHEEFVLDVTKFFNEIIGGFKYCCLPLCSQ